MPNLLNTLDNWLMYTGNCMCNRKISKSSMKKTFFLFPEEWVKVSLQTNNFLWTNVALTLLQGSCWRYFWKGLWGADTTHPSPFTTMPPKQCLKGLKHGRKKPRSKPAIRVCQTEPTPHKCQTIYALAKARTFTGETTLHQAHWKSLSGGGATLNLTNEFDICDRIEQAVAPLLCVAQQFQLNLMYTSLSQMIKLLLWCMWGWQHFWKRNYFFTVWKSIAPLQLLSTC